MGNLLVCENYRGILLTLLTMHSYPDRYMCVGRNLLILLCLPFEGERRLVSVVPIDYKIPAINQDIHDSWRFLINSRAKAYNLVVVYFEVHIYPNAPNFWRDESLFSLSFSRFAKRHYIGRSLGFPRQ